MSTARLHEHDACAPAHTVLSAISDMDVGNVCWTWLLMSGHYLLQLPGRIQLPQPSCTECLTSASSSAAASDEVCQVSTGAAIACLFPRMQHCSPH